MTIRDDSGLTGGAEHPRVAVIVPNYNGSQYLPACLASLGAQTYSNYTVTVVDNASVDDSVELIRRDFPNVELIQNSHNTGFAGGCNAGLRVALKGDADCFVLANSDIKADANWLSELVKVAFSDPRTGICQSLIYMYGQPQTINTAGNEAHYLGFGFCGHYLEKDAGQFVAGQDIPFASGTAMLVKREVLNTVGLLDEDLFMYQEDLDFSWRARIAGYRVVLAPASRIYHNYAFSRNRLKFYYLERNRLIVNLKNYSARTLLVLAPAFIGAEAAMLGYSLAGGWLGQKLKGYLYVFRNLDRVREKRALVQRGRRAPDSELVSYWTDRMGFADLTGSPLTRIANPLSAAYWKLARRLL